MATASERKEVNWETSLLAKVNHLLCNGKNNLRILVTGRTGAGKSALVNSIVGEYVADEGDLPRGVTIKVTRYEKYVGGIVVTIYDSPGLQDGFEHKETEEKYMKDLEENCSEVDLNLYCVKMTDKVRQTEIDAIVKFSNAFGMDGFWQNTLIVLTFANEVKPPKSGNITPVDYFKKRMLQWNTLLSRVLIENANIAEEVVKKVPIIPAGYFDEPSLPAAESDYWFSHLWFQCLDRTKDIARPLLLNINLERLWSSDEVKEKDIVKKRGYEQPIFRDVVNRRMFKSYLSNLFTRGG